VIQGLDFLNPKPGYQIDRRGQRGTAWQGFKPVLNSLEILEGNFFIVETISNFIFALNPIVELIAWLGILSAFEPGVISGFLNFLGVLVIN
jgi:hypothetical protein